MKENKRLLDFKPLRKQKRRLKQKRKERPPK